MTSSSSGRGSIFALVNGTTAPGADAVAGLRVGDNSGTATGAHEYMIDGGGGGGEAGGGGPSGAAYGHLTWDPAYDGPGTPFFTVAPVRLDVRPGELRWSVGTNDFIACACRPFTRITRVQVAALAGAAAPDRLVQWDALTVTFHHADGQVETHASPCLPRVSTARPRDGGAVRRTASAAAAPAPLLQQYADIVAHWGDVIRVQLTGQVTLRADRPAPDATPLGADDLQGRILVFTDTGDFTAGPSRLGA